MYLSDNAVIFLKLYFITYLMFFVIIGSNKLGKQQKHLVGIALIWYILSGIVFVPISISTYRTYSWDMFWALYGVYFLVIGAAVFVSLVISACYKRNKSFLFSFLYLMPGFFVLTIFSFSSGRSISSGVVETFFSGIIASIIYLLDCKFNFSKSYRVIFILACCLAILLVTIFTPAMTD